MNINSRYLDCLSKEEKRLLGNKFWEDIFWIKLNSKSIDDDFLIQNAEFLNWHQVTRYYLICEKQIEKFANYADWNYLTEFRVLSKEILIKHKYKYLLDFNNMRSFFKNF